NTIRKLDTNDDLAGEDVEDVAEFGGEDTGKVLAGFDKVSVAVAGAGEAGHEVLVVIEPDSNGGDGDVFAGEGLAETFEVGRGGGADISDAVGQEEDPVDERAVEVFADFGGALVDAAVEGGHAARCDGADLCLD